MSFYGSIYYELIDAFYKILVHNTGYGDGVSFPKPENIKNEQALVAIGRQGVIDMDTGNDWIQITTDPSKTKYILWHGKANPNTTKDLVSFSKIEESDIPADTEPIQLVAGDIIASSTSSYDMAGHISSSDATYYKLPVSTVEQDVKDIKEDIEEINKELEEQSNIIGDFKTEFEDDLIYDESRHGTITKRLASVGYIDHVYTKGDIGKTMANAIGDITFVYPNGWINGSLSGAIGEWEKYQPRFQSDTVETTDDAGETKHVPVSNISLALAALKTNVSSAQENATAANNSFNLLKDKVDALEARIKALEGT